MSRGSKILYWSWFWMVILTRLCLGSHVTRASMAVGSRIARSRKRLSQALKDIKG
jgi:hypothetical protein